MEERSDRRRILFVAYGGGHAVMLAEVIRTLASNPAIECQALGLTTGYQTLAETGVRTWRFKDLIQPGDETALAIGARLAEQMGPSALIDQEESAAYLGLSMSELVARHGAAEADMLYEQKGRIVFHPEGAVGRLLDRLKPALVVTTNSPRAERAALHAARARGIPSLCLCDAFIRSDFELSYLAKSDYGTKIGVFAQLEAEALQDNGRARETIEIVGNPAFDTIADPDLKDAGRRRRADLGWTDLKVLIVALAGAQSVFSPDSDRLNTMLLDGAERALIQDSRLRVILRPHPSTAPPDSAEAALARWGERATLSPRDRNRHAEVHAADMLATPRSTLAIEAALAGKPCATLYSKDFPSPMGEVGLSTECKSAEELAAAIFNAAPPMLEKLGVPPVGTHASLAAALIHKMAEA